MTNTSRTPICQNTVSAYDGEFFGICIIQAGHAGNCDFIDTMGMCMENDDCRATREGWSHSNQPGQEHNH